MFSGRCFPAIVFRLLFSGHCTVALESATLKPRADGLSYAFFNSPSASISFLSASSVCLAQER